MEKFNLENDLVLLYKPVESFPQGMPEAFGKLKSTLKQQNDRVLYGISHGSETGKIHYHVAVLQAYEGEGTALGLDTWVIKAGEYQTVTLLDSMKRCPFGYR